MAERKWASRDWNDDNIWTSSFRKFAFHTPTQTLMLHIYQRYKFVCGTSIKIKDIAVGRRKEREEEEDEEEEAAAAERYDLQDADVFCEQFSYNVLQINVCSRCLLNSLDLD